PRPAGLGELHFLGKALLAATTGSSLALWEVADGEPVIAGAAPASLGSVLAHPQNGMLVVASSGTGFTSESNVLVWNASAPTAPPLVLPHSDRQYAAAFSPDGKCLITGGMGQAVRVWDLTTLRQACEPLVQFQNAIQAIATHPDGERIA